MFPAPVCRKSLLRTNARRGALNAPQLLPPVPPLPAPVQRRSRAAFLAAPRFRPGPALRGSTSRPAGHLWASPFLRTRKPKSSGRRRAGRWTQSPSGPERGGIVPERAHTPPGYTDDRPKERKTNFSIHGRIGAHLLAPQFVRQDSIKFKKGHCRVRKNRPPRHVNSQGARPSSAIGTVAPLRNN